MCWEEKCVSIVPLQSFDESQTMIMANQQQRDIVLSNMLIQGELRDPQKI